jgi:hypothetical protein
MGTHSLLVRHARLNELTAQQERFHIFESVKIAVIRTI